MSMTVFESTWWTAVIPKNWDVDEDDVCATFQSVKMAGVVQLSVAENTGADVTDDDLIEFASENIAERQVTPVATQSFKGIHVEFIEDDTYWRQWWLRSGHFLFYVTYNAAKDLAATDRQMVDSFIAGLRPRSS